MALEPSSLNKIGENYIPPADPTKAHEEQPPPTQISPSAFPATWESSASPLDPARVKTTFSPLAAHRALATAEVASKNNLNTDVISKSSLLLQALDRAPSEAAEHADSKPAIQEPPKSELTPLEKAKAKFDQAKQEFEAAKENVEHLEKQLDKAQSYLSTAIAVAKKLTQETDPERVAIRDQVGPKLIEKMRDLKAYIEKTEQELSEAYTLASELGIKELEADVQYEDLKNPSQVSPQSNIDSNARRAGFTEEDVRTFTTKTHTRTELPKLQKKATVATLSALDPWRDPLKNIIVKDGKLSATFDNPTPQQTKEAVTKLFELINSENKTGADLEKILHFLQTNRATSRAIDSNSELKHELRTHLQKLSNEDNLLYLKNQLKLLKNNPDFKLTSKDNLVYLVPKSRIGFEFRTGASKEAKQAINLILKQMKESAELLPELTGVASRNLGSNLNEMKQTIGELQSTQQNWWNATVSKHNLGAKITEASDTVSTAFSKLTLTKDNIVDRILTLSTKDTLDMGNALRVYRMIDMSSDEFFNQLANKLRAAPNDQNLKNQIYIVLSAWFSDHVINQNEWNVLNNHSLLGLLPTNNEVSGDWKDLKNAIDFQAAKISQQTSTPQPISPPITPYNTLDAFKTNSAELREFNKLMNGEGREQFLNDLVIQINRNDKKLFSQLNASEFKGQAWLKPDKEVTSPNIMALIKTFNRNSTFAMAVILSQPDSESRTKAIKFFLDLCSKLQDSGNFNSTYSYYAGLNNSFVRNLSEMKTLLAQDSNYNNKMDNLQKLVDSTGASSALRKALDDRLPKPSIPFLGIYLTDLVFLSETSDKKSIKMGQAEIYSKTMNNVFNAVDFPTQVSLSEFRLDTILNQVPRDIDDELNAAYEALKAQTTV